MPSLGSAPRRSWRAAPCGRAADAEAGSILIEALIAIAILSMVLAAAYNLIGASALRAKAAESARTAGLIAQSQLAAVGPVIPLSPGETTGLQDGYSWRVAIDETASAPSATGRLMRVTVTVGSQGARRVRISTLRLAPAG
jgi:general secretion pathway protein I